MGTFVAYVIITVQFADPGKDFPEELLEKLLNVTSCNGPVHGN